MRRLTRPAATVATVALALSVGLPTGVGYAAYQHDRKVAYVLPERTLVGGIDVSGLSRAGAIAAVERSIAAQLDRVAVLQVGAASYRVTARELGVGADVPGAVDAAMTAAHEGSWLSRSWSRLTGSTPHPKVDVALTEPEVSQLERIVRRAAQVAEVKPVDATAALRGGFVTFGKSKTGLALDRRAALTALTASLRDGKPRRVDPKTVQPTVADDAFDTVVLVRVNENKLYVYKQGQITRTFPVATGSSQYPTPLGRFHVTLKRFMPTWVNPHPNEGWGRFEPKSIPPGPGNPLGLRALNISAPNIRIHGTPADSSIGYNASHGCIRMHNSDVVQLYPLIPKGAPVFITKVGPPKIKPAKAKLVVEATPPTEGG